MGNDIKIEPGSMWFRADDFNAKVNILTADDDVIRYQYLIMNDHGDLSLGRANRDQFLKIFIKWDDEYERFRLGSIWEAVQGCYQASKGKKIKITGIFGDIVEWVFLDNFEKTEDHCTCKSTFIHIFTRIADNDNGAIYRSIEPPIGMVKVKNTKPIFSISSVTVQAFTSVEYTEIKPQKYCESHITGGKVFHAKYELFSLNPEKEFAAPLSEMPTPLGANEEETNIDDKIFTERLELEVEGSWWKRIDDDAIGTILEICDNNSNNLVVRWTHPSFEGSRAGTYDRYEFARKWVPLASHIDDIPVKVDSIWKSNKTGDMVKVLIEPSGCDHCVHYINLNDTTGDQMMSHVDKAVFITEHTFLRDNDNGALYRHNRNPNMYLKVIETTEKVWLGALTRFVKYRVIKGDSVEDGHESLMVTFHECCHLLSLDPEKEYTVPIDSVRTIKVDDKEMAKIPCGSLWVDVETGKDTVKVSFIASKNGEVFVHYVDIATGIERAEKLEEFVTVYERLKDNDLSAIYEKRNNPLEWVQIVICNPNSACMSYHHYGGEFNGRDDKNDIANFHKQYKLITFYPSDADIERMNINALKSSKYHKIAKELRDVAKECDITIGSIWRNVKGAEEYKGRLIKVFHINGDSISWRYLTNAEGCPKIGPNRRSTKTTSESLFLYCFEKVQDNDDGAIYQPFDRVHDARENPGKYQMVKVVETNVSTTTEGSAYTYGMIKYITTPISSSVYSVTLGEFHSEFELVSLNPAEEFSTDTNDPNYSRKHIDPNKGESKMEDNETYLKTDKDKLEDFGTGAKREDKSGKGRYDLIPGDVMQNFEDFCWAYYFSEGPTTCSATDVSKSAYFDDWSDVDSYYDFMLNMISYFFVSSCDKEECEDDLGEVSYSITWDGFRKGIYEMRKALAKHYEAGAVVHGVDNWKKGLPIYGSKRGGCFLDSMRRHADQALMGKTDEPHAIAAIWNAVGAIWTLKHIPKSAICQNTSTTKADEKPKSAHFDMIDSCIGALKYMNKDKDHLSATKIITPSDKKFTIRKWPEGFEPVVDFEKEALMKEMLNYPSYNDFIKSVREATEKKKYDIMLQWCYASHNLYKCIDVLRSIVKNDKFSKLDTRVTTVYFNIYMIFKTIDRIFVLFQEDSEAIKQILKIISDFHIMINLKVGHIERCCGNIILNWEKYSPEYLRTFECAGSVPDEDEINILYEMIGRTSSVLLRSDEKGKLDYFRGLGITQSLLEFNTKFLKDKVYKNKK